MYILCSRGRPAGVARFIRAYRATCARLPVLLRLDWDDPRLVEYDATVPESWLTEIGPRKPVAQIYNDIFERYPAERFYGLLADDLLPQTRFWDHALMVGAGRFGVAYGDDKLQGAALATHPVIAGDLVRAVGWLAPPSIQWLYVDTVWTTLGHALGTLQYLPNVITEHLHYSTGKSDYDQTYQDHARYGSEDARAFRAWKSLEAGALVDRLKATVMEA